MEYLVGSKEKFWKFVDSINEDDKVGIITHTDLDGIASAIFLEKILNSKGIQVDSIFFTGYKKDIFKNIIPKLNKITKVFLTDMYADGIDAQGFEKLKNNCETFVIDHHPVVNKNAKNTIKTESSDCSAYALFDLGEEIINKEKWKMLLYATMISEMSYKNPENMEFLKKDYPNLSEENILSSSPGELAKTISGALIYFSSLKRDLIEIYNLIKKQDFETIKKYNKEVQKEIDFHLKEIKEKAQYFPKKDLYLYYFNPNFNITSVIGTIFSCEHKNSSIIILSDIDENKIKVSARNQNKKQDMSALLKKGIQGLDDAVAGGHVPAAGGSFLKKDLNKFKENILL